MRLTQILLLTGFLMIFSFHDAFAYVDPGTGSMIIQVIIGALVAIGVGFKVYWYKFKEKFSRVKNNDTSKTDEK